jgi:2,4-dienoyl-CoA reductase-like NADH-dependent reductase (Old Yellow Enzyme family)
MSPEGGEAGPLVAGDRRAADLDPLWRPLMIGAREIPNRVMISAHNTTQRVDRYVAFLERRASGGAGLIVTGGLPVAISSLASPLWIRAWEPETAAVYTRLSSAVHRHSGTLFVQLMHIGHQDVGTTSLEDSHALVAPSSIPSPVWNVQPQALEQDEIAEIVEAFGASAAIARDGGMDGVEVHGAHGYLLHEFLSPLTNRRTDRYGGNAANRARLVIEAGQAVRTHCGADFPVGLKLTFEDFAGDRGITPRRALETLAVIHAAGVFDYVSIGGASYHSLHQLVPPAESGQSGHLAPHAALAKTVLGALPVMVTGGVSDLWRAAEIIAAGQADAVGMVRAHLADPMLVNKARAGELDAIRPCVGANQGCWRRVFRGGEITCTVNPEAGREGDWGEAFFAPAAEAGRVVVVGAGPGGLKAAESAARRGHEVILLERESELGGQLRFAGRLPGRARWLGFIEQLRRSVERLGVEVRMGQAASPDSVAALNPDWVVVASGASWDTSGFSLTRPDRDSIPGAEAEHVIDPVRAVAETQACGERVLLLDEQGTHIALGLAELLVGSGRAVEFVTSHPQPGAHAGVLGTVDLPWIYPRLIAAGVSFTVEATIERIDRRSVELRHLYGGWTQTVEDLDCVVLCMGRRPEDDLFKALQKRDFRVERIGDCKAPREVDDAVLEGARAAIGLSSALA